MHDFNEVNGLNRQPVNKRLIVILVLSIVLLIVLNQFDGPMENGSDEDNRNTIDQNNNTVQVASTPKVMPTHKEADSTKGSFKLTPDEIADLANKGVIEDSFNLKQNDKIYRSDEKVSMFEDKGILYFYTLSGDLYRIDDSSERKLVHDFGKLYKVINDWIYYYPVKNGEIFETRPQYHGDPGKDIVLKCVRNNGEDEKVVYKSYNYQGWQSDIKLICNDDKWLYYHIIALGGGGSGEGMMNPDFGLFGKMKIGSSEKIEYRDFRMYRPLEKDGYIYYISIYPIGFAGFDNPKEAIKRINLKTLKHELILELDNWTGYGNFRIFNDRIYYATEDGSTKRVKLDGSDSTKIDTDFPTEYVTSFPIVTFVPGYIMDKGKLKEVLAAAYKEERVLQDTNIELSTGIRLYDEDMNNVLGGKTVSIPEEFELERIKSITVYENVLYLKVDDEYFGYSISN